MYQAGFCELDITPPIGTIIPGYFHARYSQGVLDPLYARACVIRQGDGYAAFVTADCCGLYRCVTDEVRRRVAEQTPIPPERVMVMATHTHSGGPTLNWGEEVRIDPVYLESFVKKLADALIVAWQRMADSQLAFGEEQLQGVSFIRVYRMKDGSLKTNPGCGNPEAAAPVGQVDPAVSVLSVRQNGRPVGAVVNFACHPAVVGGLLTSADYIGVLSQQMKERFGPGFVTVFINGACGNINHFDLSDPSTFLPERYLQMGRELAAKAAAAVESPLQLLAEGPVTVCESVLSAGLRKPTREMVNWAWEHIHSLGGEYAARTPDTPEYFETFFAIQTFTLMLDKRQEAEIYLQLLRIGDLEVFGTPCQLFVEFGRAMKEGSAAPFSMVSAFANDYLGYVPTPECMTEGVYEARLAPTSCLASDTGGRIVEAMLEMSRQLGEKL